MAEKIKLAWSELVSRLPREAIDAIIEHVFGAHYSGEQTIEQIAPYKWRVELIYTRSDGLEIVIIAEKHCGYGEDDEIVCDYKVLDAYEISG